MKFCVRKMIKILFFLPIGFLFRTVVKEPFQAKILMYHRVNDLVRKEMVVSKDNFQWQMSYLKKKKYVVISMDELVHRLESNTLFERYVVLTFDDGYADYFESAIPILQQYQFPSINYLVTGYIESHNIFWWDSDLGENQLMTWKQIEELNKYEEVSFGAHTVYHPDLDQLEEKEILLELANSKAIIEQKLNKKVNHFCYPRGKSNQLSINLVRKIYQTGVLIYTGEPVKGGEPSLDLAKLKRVPIQNSDGKLLFIARLHGWLVVEEAIRSIWRKLHGIKNK